MTNDDRELESEVVNKDWQLDVVRTYSLGVEILDRRLKDGEYRLLHLLRLRASGGRNNKVTYNTLAKDLGIHSKTIAERMASLKKHGYITCEKTGYSSPTLKTITSMVERYDHDILNMSRKDMLGNGRTDELLRRLHCVDNAPEDPLGVKTLPMESSSIGSENAPSLGVETLPIKGVKTLPQVNKQVNASEKDVTRFARDSPKNDLRIPEEDSDELTTVVPDRSDPEEETPRDDDRQAKSQALADKTMADTTAKSTVARKKRNEKRVREDADGTTEAREVLKKMTQHERMTVGSRFYHWAKSEYELFFPEANLRFPEWEPKEFAFLKRLMEIYHQDEKVIRSAWSFMCENWDTVRKKLKIADVTPTIGLFYFLRGRIFPLAQERKTNRQVAEQKTVSDKQGEW